MTTALTRQQQDDLRACEQVISRGIDTFREVGAALAKIRGDRLYKGEYKTFESYCNTRWGFGKSQAYRLIEAAGAPEMSPTGDKIENEHQARKYLQEQRKPRDPAGFEQFKKDAAHHHERHAAKQTVAPADADQDPCRICGTFLPVAGGDRCQRCIDEGRTEPDDDDLVDVGDDQDSVVEATGAPRLTKGTADLLSRFLSLVAQDWHGAKVTAKRDKIEFDIPDGNPVGIALDAFWEAYNVVMTALETEQNR